VSAYWFAKAHNYIRNHFHDWLNLLGRKMKNFWSAFQYDDLSIITTLREEGVIFPGLSFGIVAALAIPGLLLACADFRLSRWIAAAILLHMLSLLSVFVTERYRLAAVPGLLLFAAYGLWELWQTSMSSNYRRVSVYCASLVTSAWFVSIPQRDSSLWALDSYNTGLLALDSNHLALAQQKLERAYSYVPENAEINFAIGNLRFAQGNAAAAKSYYLATLRLNPQHEGAYNNLGVIALQGSQWQLAEKFFSKALEQNPHDAKTCYLLAQAHLKVGDIRNASTAIAEAIKLNPNQPEFIALRDEIEKADRP
jgi:tetratricopeptide (TPR) repeat protein